MTDLIIFPYNANGIEAIDCLSKDFNFIGFVDDLPEKHGISLTGHQVSGREIFNKYKKAKILAMPGGPNTYLQKPNHIQALKLPEERYAQIIHPSAQISKLASLGKNVLIMAGVIITPKTVIGNHVCILPNSVIHHDVHIGDYCWIGSNVVIAGAVKLGKNVFIGSSSSVINNISIGDGALVGLGSTVVSSVKAFDKVAGNPAKSLPK